MYSLDKQHHNVYTLSMIRSQIYLEQEQIRFLKRVAHEKNVTMSDVIRGLIDSRLNKKVTKINSGEWALELAKKAESMKIKGPKNLSTDSDKYLYK